MMHNKFIALDNAVRVTAMIFLISFCWPLVGYSQVEDVNRLIQKLNDKEASVRPEAVDSLGEIKDTSVIEHLIHALKDDDRYIMIFLEDGSSALRGEVVDSLIKIGTPAVEPLIAALGDENIQVRWKAAEALGEIKDIRAVKPLIAARKDESFKVRSKATEALGEIKNIGAVESLIAGLNDEDSEVRWMAAEALGKIKATSAVEPLIVALMDDDSVHFFFGSLRIDNLNIHVRGKAAEALGEIKDARAAEVLITALKDEDLEIVAGAYRFFIRRGESGTEGVLIKALDKYGTRGSILMDFLNCGNNLLEKAASTWAKNHNYQIVPTEFRYTGIRWRSAR